jgi:uncharacterized protein YdhG (YjbR/CyaY superfamily)
MLPSAAVDAYIASFGPELRARLEALRVQLRTLLPEAEEKMSYGMPTYKQGRNLFHFAAHARHIGLYPGPQAIEVLAAELTSFKVSKGTIRIPHSEPLPVDLIARLARFNLDSLKV